MYDQITVDLEKVQGLDFVAWKLLVTRAKKQLRNAL